MGRRRPRYRANRSRWEREGEILFCPWHGWEFDLLTGACLTDRRKLRRFSTSIENGWIHVHVRDR